MNGREDRAAIIALKTAAGLDLAARVKVAASFHDRAVGLLGRSTIQADEGMLFEPGGSIHTFGMRTRIDVAFLDRELRVLKVSAAVPPWRMRLAPIGTRYTLELAPGRLAACELRTGERLQRVTTLGRGPRRI